MGNWRTIATPIWTREELIASLDEFVSLYQQRPIQDNTGGMKAPHLFAVWFMARALDPELIVESGIWKGQGTWLIEQACPSARIISLDPDLSKRVYISEKVAYSHLDFSLQDWTDLPAKSLVLFDDHQNAYRRLQQCHWFGFKHIIFEDNYPALQGDCYSLKKAFSHAGLPSLVAKKRIPLLRQLLRRLLYGLNAKCHLGLAIQGLEELQERIHPNQHDAVMIEKKLAMYYEFPPVVKHPLTRWGDPWEAPGYPTDPPLIVGPIPDKWHIFDRESQFYNWICYVNLR